MFCKKEKEILDHQDYFLEERKREKNKDESETFLEYIEDQLHKAKNTDQNFINLID